MNKRIITVDNGGSELRYIANSDGRTIVLIDKHMSVIDREDFRPKDNVETFDVVDIISAPRNEYCGLYTTGVGYYMYIGADIAMTGQNRKSETLAWYQQIIIAIAKDAIQARINDGPIQKIIKNADGEQTIIPKDDTYNYILTTLIPVNEHSGSKDYVTKVKDNLAGTYEVRFPMIKDGINSVKFVLEKSNIGVLPEGVVVLSSIAKEISPNDYTLILDMGHVTMDSVICKGFTMMGNSVISSPFAGGTMLKLIHGIAASHGLLSTDEMAVDALRTYTLRIGKKVIDITREMDNAKRSFITNYIKREIISQIELSGISAASIQNIVPIGAVLGITNPKTGNYDILEMIIEECGLTNAELKILNEDLRYVNISKAADFCDAFAATLV